MKKTLFTALLVLATVIPVSLSHAAATPTTLTEVDVVTRKQATQDSLQTLLTRLTTISAHAQSTTDNLAANDIDVTTVEALLIGANANFAQAKIDIDLFAKNQTSTAKKVDDDIRLGRNQLSQAILALKTIVNG